MSLSIGRSASLVDGCLEECGGLVSGLAREFMPDLYGLRLLNSLRRESLCDCIHHVNLGGAATIIICST